MAARGARQKSLAQPCPNSP